MHVLAVPDQPHEVLEGGGDFRAAVVLEDGHVDEDVRIEDSTVDEGGFHAAGGGTGDFAVGVAVVGLDHFAAGLRHGIGNAGIAVAPLPTVTSMVKDLDLRGPGCDTLADNLRDKVRIGVRTVLGGTVPADVGLDNYLLTGADEGCDTTQFGDALAEEGLWFATAHRHHFALGTCCRRRLGGGQRCSGCGNCQRGPGH